VAFHPVLGPLECAMLTPGTKVYYKGKVHEIDMVGTNTCTLVGVRGKVPLSKVVDVLTAKTDEAQALICQATSLLQEALERVQDDDVSVYTNLRETGLDLEDISKVLGLDPEYWNSSSARC